MILYIGNILYSVEPDLRFYRITNSQGRSALFEDNEWGIASLVDFAMAMKPSKIHIQGERCRKLVEEFLAMNFKRSKIVIH